MSLSLRCPETFREEVLWASQELQQSQPLPQSPVTLSCLKHPQRYCPDLRVLGGQSIGLASTYTWQALGVLQTAWSLFPG